MARWFLSNNGTAEADHVINVSVAQLGRHLEACVSWVLALNNPDFVYTLHWVRMSCRADPAYPACNEPSDYWSEMVALPQVVLD